MADWWSLAGDAAKAGYDWWRSDEQTSGSKDNILSGLKDARQDIKKTTGPYQDYAQWGMEGYKAEQPFDFNYEGYLTSPEFQWLQDQTRQATERGAAAGQKGLYSGQTLADLDTNLYNLNASAYGAEHQRQLQAQQARENYWWRPVSAGATLAGDTARSLANLSTAKGDIRAQAGAQKDQNFNQFIEGMIPDKDPSKVQQVGDAVKEVYDALGGEDVMGDIGDFAKELLGDSEIMKDLGLDALGDWAGDMGDWAGNLANGSITGLLGANTGLASWGPGSQAAMLAQQTAEFGLEGTKLTVDALESAMSGANAAGQSAGLASDAMSFLSSPAGMGLSAAAITLIMGGDVKDAVVSGGASYLGAAIGSAIMPGIGTMIGGAIGGMVASWGFGDKVAKADSVMMLSQDDTGFKKDLSAEGAFGYIGFKGSATRHLDEQQLKKAYLPAFQTLAKMDDMVAAAMTPEELAKVKEDIGARYKYRKQSNEGKISPNKVMRNTLRDRMKMLKKSLGEARFNELQLGDMYTAMLNELKKKKGK